jgi:hypothetical protein
MLFPVSSLFGSFLELLLQHVHSRSTSIAFIRSWFDNRSLRSRLLLFIFFDCYAFLLINKQRRYVNLHLMHFLDRLFIRMLQPHNIKDRRQLWYTNQPNIGLNLLEILDCLR